jgi:hypothetical protein
MKLKLLSLIFLLSISNAYAGKYDITTGFFSLSGKNSGKSSTVSGLGIYEASYINTFKEKFEFFVGYSLTMTGIVGGDMSFGPKLGINFFPLNYSSNEIIQLEGKTIEVHDYWKPYIGVSFNQRQFQSVKNSFAGLGFNLGTEKYINQQFTIKTELKLNTYTGPSNSSASEMNLLVGLVYGF